MAKVENLGRRKHKTLALGKLQWASDKSAGNFNTF